MQSVLLGWGLELVRGLARPAHSPLPRVDVSVMATMIQPSRCGRCVPLPLCVRVSNSHKTSLRWAFLSALLKVRKLRLGEGKRGGVKEKLLKSAQQQESLYPSLEVGRGVTTPGSA